MTKEEVMENFEINPDAIGLRNRSWWIVEEIEDEEEYAGAQIGDLCIKTRDGASNPFDTDAFIFDNFVGTIEDGFDSTYRYYY